jgi:hypothetical protein
MRHVYTPNRMSLQRRVATPSNLPPNDVSDSLDQSPVQLNHVLDPNTGGGGFTP